jgi:hypothetical protein
MFGHAAMPIGLSKQLKIVRVYVSVCVCVCVYVCVCVCVCVCERERERERERGRALLYWSKRIWHQICCYTSKYVEIFVFESILNAEILFSAFGYYWYIEILLKSICVLFAQCPISKHSKSRILYITIMPETKMKI